MTPEVGLSVTEVNDRAEFVHLEKDWNALADASSAELFYRHQFLLTWLDNFAARLKWRILIARNSQDKWVGALALVERRVRLYGLPVRELSSASNAHSCRFDLLASDAEGSADAFGQYLLKKDDWDLLRLADVPEGGHGWKLHQYFQGRGLPVGVWSSLQSPFVPLPNQFDVLQARLNSKFRSNLRRRRKKLAEKGDITFDRLEGAQALSHGLEQGLALECSGWKGKRGSAILQSRDTYGFYAELARCSAYRGELSLYFLKLDGKPIAFHFGLSFDKNYLLLKPAYDETLNDCSPGQLLTENVIRDCIERGFSQFDFLGPDMPWKRDWTGHLRPHYWLFVFRDSRKGRFLKNTKFKWMPWLKERVA